MRRLAICLALAAVSIVLPTSAGAADFGVDEFDVTYTAPDGSPAIQAGSHPFAMTTSLHFNTVGEGETEAPAEAPKDIVVSQIPGLAGSPTAPPTCTTLEFLTVFFNAADERVPACPDSTAIGVISSTVAGPDGPTPFFGAVYNLEPPPGKAARIGFWIEAVPLTVDLGVSESFPYTVLGGPTNIPQTVEVIGAQLTLWGVPADPAHNSFRGHCIAAATGISFGSCPPGVSERPFLTLPRACAGPLTTEYEADSWGKPGEFVRGSVQTHDPAGLPQGLSGCGRVGFSPEVSADPTTTSAESSSGLDFEIDTSTETLENPSYEAVADADIESITTVLPAGVTANPSAAEGLDFCTLGEFKAEALQAPAGTGCPDASKLGSLEASTPLLEDHTLRGSVYLAEPEANPFNSFMALYFVIRDPERGVFVKLGAKVVPDPRTGQLVTTVEDLPPFPLSHVALHLRSGPRAPLVTPPTCGTYETKTLLTPTSGAAPLESNSTFTVTSGSNGGPCPVAQPFAPGFSAGTLNNAAGRYSPFLMRIVRRDGEQDLTRFSATLPAGVTGKLAGLVKCPDSGIDAAKTKTARAEIASPSCPATSRIGSLLGGAGVGSELTFVPGSLYVAGPYQGAPMSVAAIVPALAGPFDVGTIVTRVGLRLNPETARVEVDGAASDPIPHILKGIPLKVRELRVSTDRPSFTLNSTGCRRRQTAATFGGSGSDSFSFADDTLATAVANYQAASCASLGFKPKLTLKLKGGTKRGQNPAARAVLTPRPGDANIETASVVLPHTEFIDQAHINNPCTRVQFFANQCPPGSVLGTVRAFTPLLDQPFEGFLYFRSNGGERKLPDIVADVRSEGLRIIQVGFVDSVRARIRTRFLSFPDAPISKVVLNFYGGKKGLLVNSGNLCGKKQHAEVQLTGQNGKSYNTKPVVGTSCKTKSKHGGPRRSRAQYRRT